MSKRVVKKTLATKTKTTKTKLKSQASSKSGLKIHRKTNFQEKRRRSNTKAEILEAAKDLLQKFGYHGFSFQQVADIVRVRKPSLFEHFASKEILGEALIQDYHEGFELWAQALDSVSPSEKLKALFELFYRFSRDHRKFCPLTAFTANANDLPQGMERRLVQLHRSQKRWLVAVLQAGKRQKIFKNKSTNRELSDLIMTMAYGAQLSARILNQPRQLRLAGQQTVRILSLP